MDRVKSNLFKIVFNSLLGVVLVAIWLHFVDIRQIWLKLSTVEPRYLVLVVICLMASPILRALRLKILLSPIKKLEFLDILFLNGFSMMLSFLIPIRAGEIAKSIYISNNYKLPIPKTLLWIFLDRFVDFLVVLILGGLLLTLIPTNFPERLTVLAFIIFITTLVVFYLMVFQVKLARKLLEFLTPLLIVNIIKRYFVRIYDFFLDSLQIFNRHPKDLGAVFILTILAYVADGGVWYFTFRALSSNQDFIKMVLGQVLSALTYLIPAAPGYVGSAEASGVLLLTYGFGIETNLASAMIVLYHLITAVLLIAFGIFSMYFLKINLSEILNKIFKK